MKKYLFTILVAMNIHAIYADNHFPNIQTIPHLKDFKNTQSFEKYIKNKEQECITKHHGIKVKQCLLEDQFWQRELNFYYHQLHEKLNSKQQTILERLHDNWLQLKAETVIFNQLLDINSKSLNSNNYDPHLNPNTKMLKARTLILKHWYESIPD